MYGYTSSSFPPVLLNVEKNVSVGYVPARSGLHIYIVYGKSAAESTGKIKKVSGELKIFEFPVTKRAAARHFAFRIDNMLPYYAGLFCAHSRSFFFCGLHSCKALKTVLR